VDQDVGGIDDEIDPGEQSGFTRETACVAIEFAVASEARRPGRGDADRPARIQPDGVDRADGIEGQVARRRQPADEQVARGGAQCDVARPLLALVVALNEIDLDFAAADDHVLADAGETELRNAVWRGDGQVARHRRAVDRRVAGSRRDRCIAACLQIGERQRIGEDQCVAAGGDARDCRCVEEVNEGIAARIDEDIAGADDAAAAETEADIAAPVGHALAAEQRQRGDIDAAAVEVAIELQAVED